MRTDALEIGNAELLRVAIEASTGYAIFAIDDDGTVIRWNVGAERLLGYRDTDIVGHNGDVIFTPEDRLAGAPQREREVARAHGRAEDERWHQRRDGTRFWASGLLAPLPVGRGFMKIMRDQTERHLAEQRLQASEARFRTLATNIPQLVFASRASGERTWGSPQWVLFTGLDEWASLNFGWLDAIHPDDREITMEGWKLAQTTGTYDVEHRIRATSNELYRWHRTRANPLEPDALATTEWVGTSTDVHDLRSLNESQDVLLAELQHRTRNLIAMIQALMKRSVRMSGSLEAFRKDFEHRLSALSRAESLLPVSGTGTVDIRKLIETELSAHIDESSASNLTIDGESAGIPVSLAQIVALAIHELSTNAVKYGALRDDGGRLHISWRIVDSGNERELILTWMESGVAMPERTLRKGYGSELIERALPYQLGAPTKLQFDRDGVSCEIRIPMVRG